MKFKDYIKNAFRNLRRRKMRTFLTSFAVSIGAMLIILMVSLGVGVQKIVIDTIKSSTPGNTITVSPYKYDDTGLEVKTSVDEEALEEAVKPKFTKIDDGALKKIRNMNAVEEMSVYSSIGPLNLNINEKSKKISAVGVDLNYSLFTKEQIESIRIKEKKKDLNPITYGNILSQGDKNSVLIGEKLLKRLGIEDFNSVVGKEITLTSTLPEAVGIPKIEPMTKKFKIVGVISEKFSFNDKVVMNIEDGKEFLSYLTLEKNYYGDKGPETVEVTVKNLTDVAPITEEISKMNYGVTSIQSMIKGVKSAFAIVQAVLAVVGAIIIFVASIGVINTMTMSIYERTRSIGIMKALGASRKDIRWLFIVESGAIGFIGGLLGVIFSYLNTEIIKLGINAYLVSKGIKDIPQIFSTPLWLTLGTIGFAILISIVAGLHPANKASKLDPVESLRYE